jgi:hypothetical protein
LPALLEHLALSGNIFVSITEEGMIVTKELTLEILLCYNSFPNTQKITWWKMNVCSVRVEEPHPAELYQDALLELDRCGTPGRCACVHMILSNAVVFCFRCMLNSFSNVPWQA